VKNIEQLQVLKHKYSESLNWFKLIGARYEGGGGGYGNLRSVDFTVNRLEIYHQAYNGGIGYHQIPEGLKHYMVKAIAIHGEKLIKTAIELQHSDLKTVAAKAAAEYKEILEIAGIQEVEAPDAPSESPTPPSNGFSG